MVCLRHWVIMSAAANQAWTTFDRSPNGLPIVQRMRRRAKIEVMMSKFSMTRSSLCFSVLLLPGCAVLAQSLATPAAKPDPAPVSAAPSSLPAAMDVGPQIKEFQKIEDSWSNAINSRDQYSLELVLSPLFVDVSANGDITTRNQQLAQLITGEDKTMHLEQRVVTVRLLGDTAVANGTYLLHHKATSGQVDEKGVFTHVYERMRGGWVCVNSQRTTLREDAQGKKKKQASEAALPFHIPLFSKGDKNDKKEP
jgi:ketosteroid isomerase-like protein